MGTKEEKAVRNGDNPVVGNDGHRIGSNRIAMIKRLWNLGSWPAQRFWPGRLWPNAEDQQLPVAPCDYFYYNCAFIGVRICVATRIRGDTTLHNRTASTVSALNFIIKNQTPISNTYTIYISRFFVPPSSPTTTANDDDTLDETHAPGPPIPSSSSLSGYWTIRKHPTNFSIYVQSGTQTANGKSALICVANLALVIQHFCVS